MTDMFTDAPIPLAAQIACVERELALRRRVYPRWVTTGKLTEGKANAEIKGMQAVLDTLRAVYQNQDDGK